MQIGKNKVLDTRKENEFNSEHIQKAQLKPLPHISNWMKNIDPKKHFYIHYGGSYRSMIAASILQTRGFRNLTEIKGWFNAIAKTNLPKSS